MTRAQLEHVIRAAGNIVDSDELVIVGSQALLASFPDPGGVLAQSREVDLYPANAPERSIIVDGAIGEISVFDETFGYYAHGVSPETAAIPPDWRDRAVVLCNEKTRGIRGVCLSPVDLAVSKVVAGRPKDFDFLLGMCAAGMFDQEQFRRLIDTLERNDHRDAGRRNFRILDGKLKRL